MSRRRIVSVSFALACACAAHPDPQTSEARVEALFNAPADVGCIRIIATGAVRSASASFGVSPGQSTASFVVTGIPTGMVLFSGLAYGVPCGAVASDTSPTWVADDVSARVDAGGPVSVQLTFRGKGSASVGANFASDEYTVTTIAGAGGTPGTTDGVGAGALFAGPNSAALSADGRTLYVGDRNFDANGFAMGMAVRAVDLATGVVTTLAGSLADTGTADGPGAAARFTRLFAMALSGNALVISDRCAIRSMSTLPPYSVTTLVGTRSAASPDAWDCSPAATPLGAQDLDLAVRGGDVFVADGTHFAIQQVSFASSPPSITTVAGIADVPGADDGAVASATFVGPNAVAFPFVGSDVFYVVDVALDAGGYGLVRRVSLLEGSVTTVAGGPQVDFVDVDGLGTNARFAQPRRAVSDGGSLFIGDALAVRRMDLSTNAVVTLAGDGATSGFADGVGSAARFSAAFGIARDARSGTIYVADQGNFAIRMLAPR